MSDKTHQPTERKLREARQKGQIPRSKLLSGAVVTMSGLWATVAFAQETTTRLRSFAVASLSRQALPHDAVPTALNVLARCAAPTLVGALLGALAVSVATAGLQLNLEAVAPKGERLDPVAGLKKLFSLRQVVDVLKGLVVAFAVGAVLWKGVSSGAPAALKGLTHQGPAGMLATLAVFPSLLFKAGAALLVLGLADYALARWRHRKDLMMSHQEVKQEHKNSEGDPHQKSKRKALHKQLAAGGQARGVHKATAVVVNPTHIAVALRYDVTECEAPYIVAKAREEDALKLRREAQAAGIPVVKDIPLARSLVHFDVGEEVPEELYKAAAAVLKVALESTQRLGHLEEETP